MTERAVLAGAALLLVALALLAMASLHERHYKNRRWTLLEARLSALERSWLGEHD